MPKITFTEENLSAGNELSPAWYKVKLVNVEERPSKNNPDTTVYHSKFIVQDGPMKNTPVMNYFNDALMKNITDYFKAFIAPGSKVEAKTYDFDDTLNRDVMAYIQYDPERKQNSIQEFKPVGK